MLRPKNIEEGLAESLGTSITAVRWQAVRMICEIALGRKMSLEEQRNLYNKCYYATGRRRDRRY